MPNVCLPLDVSVKTKLPFNREHFVARYSKAAMEQAQTTVEGPNKHPPKEQGSPSSENEIKCSEL